MEKEHLIHTDALLNVTVILLNCNFGGECAIIKFKYWSQYAILVGLLWLVMQARPNQPQYGLLDLAYDTRQPSQSSFV